MRLHDYAASGNCLKVRLLLALLGLEHERVPVDIFAGETLTAEFAALNPARTTPVLELDDGATLAESAAILWYLAEETTYLPDDRLERARVLQWLCFERAFTPAVAGARFQIMTGRTDGETPFLLDAGRGKLAELDRRLTGREWVATDAPTIADIALHPRRGGRRLRSRSPHRHRRMDRPHPRPPGLRQRPRALSAQRASRRGPVNLRLSAPRHARLAAVRPPSGTCANIRSCAGTT
jgi:glutathione S-transferase